MIPLVGGTWTGQIQRQTVEERWRMKVTLTAHLDMVRTGRFMWCVLDWGAHLEQMKAHTVVCPLCVEPCCAHGGGAEADEAGREASTLGQSK